MLNNSTKISNFLDVNSIDIVENYHNARNGKYCGWRGRIYEINNYIEHIPWFAHSLNFITKCAAECCTETSIFSISLKISTHFLHNSRIPILKRLTNTRWSIRTDTTKALLCGFTTFKQILENISNDQKVECRNQAYRLVSKMKKLKTGIMTSTLCKQEAHHFSHIIKTLTQNMLFMNR